MTEPTPEQIAEVIKWHSTLEPEDRKRAELMCRLLAATRLHSLAKCMWITYDLLNTPPRQVLEDWWKL